MQSLAGDGRSLLARLREPPIFNAIKLYLAYVYHQPQTVCYEGFTNISLKVFLASEGLPTDLEALRKLYSNYFEAYGTGPSLASADLATFRSYVTTERQLRLQKSRESFSRYMAPINNRKIF